MVETAWSERASTQELFSSQPNQADPGNQAPRGWHGSNGLAHLTSLGFSPEVLPVEIRSLVYSQVRNSNSPLPDSTGFSG